MLNTNAEALLRARYYLRDVDGKIIENWESLCSRIANAIASAETTEEKKEKYAKEFYEMIHSRQFLPNSPTLMNAGTPDGTLFACYILGIDDSIDSIFNTVYDVAKITKMGGGVGFSVSNIRYKDAKVKNFGIASGPISFMNVFDSVIQTMKQGNRRRGALLASIRDDHPDVFEFISVKNDERKLNNFNISVSVTDAFMHAVNNDLDWNLIDHKGEVYKTIKAKELYDAIIKNAWTRGEPGMLFIDRINEDNAIKKAYGDILTTNVCGEVPAVNNSACVLGSIDLAKVVNEYNEIDYDLLGHLVEMGVRFLDNTIDVSNFPNERIEKTVKDIRAIGLGIMGFAKMLIKMGIKYDSEETLDLIDNIMTFINCKAFKVSAELGKEKGPFPVINNSKYTGQTLRNSSLLSIAPTGSISIIGDTSSGIEPFFSPFNIRRTFEGIVFEEKNFDSNYKELGDHFVTAHDIDSKWHIDVQAKFTQYVDAGISKTINLHKDTTLEQVHDIFLYAWKRGCKGLTIYRDGCRENQVLTKRK